MKFRPFSSPQRGLFVSVDGPSGAGKSTVVHHLAQLLVAIGEDVHITAEPSGGPIGSLCRELVRLRRPDLAYAAAEDLLRVAAGGHRKQGALVLLDLASAHLQTRELDQVLHVATAAVELAGRTRSERVISRARQFRRRVPAQAPQQALREFDERLRAALTRDRGLV